MLRGISFLITSVCVVLAASHAQAQPPELLRKVPTDAVWQPKGAIDGTTLGQFVPLSDPGGKALDRFYASLRQTTKGKHRTKVVVYGASHVASDSFTRRIRHWLQDRFGNAGAGFVGGFRPWRNYNNRDVNIRYSKRWRSYFVSRTRSRSDGLYGFAGASFASSRNQDYTRLSTTSRGDYGRTFSGIEVYYWKQPKGGDLQITIDGNAHTVSTQSAQPGCGYARYTLEDAAHKVEMRPAGNGQVLLFGASVERDVAGVMMDSMGINGARASAHLRWNDAVYNEHLKKRDPDLIIMAYGTNATGDADDPIDAYEARLERVLTKMRKAAPTASCVFVGPSDRPIKIRANNLHRSLVRKMKWRRQWRPIRSRGKKRSTNPVVFFRPRPRQAQVIAVQRRVAHRHACAYWDWNAMMGGSLSMLKWTHATPRLGSRDYVHHSGEGYKRAALLFWKALMVGYESKASQ
jgi:hypothetical protein